MGIADKWVWGKLACYGWPHSAGFIWVVALNSNTDLSLICLNETIRRQK